MFDDDLPITRADFLPSRAWSRNTTMRFDSIKTNVRRIRISEQKRTQQRRRHAGQTFSGTMYGAR